METGYEKKLVRLLSNTDAVSDRTLKKLIKLRNQYREKGKEVRLDQLLESKEILSGKQLKRIRSKLKEGNRERDRTEDATPSSGSASGTETDAGSSVREGHDVIRATGRADGDDAPETNEQEQGSMNPDELLPGFRVNQVLGKGGTATVFEVKHEESGKLRALKILYPEFHDSPSHLKQFKREGKLLVEFDHPNIVDAYHLGKHNGMWCLVLELLDGRTLLDRIQEEGALPEDEALDVVVEIAGALQYMQDQGYVHRDVKSENVMLLEEGGICMFDLGFAREIGSEPDLEQGETQGTVYYMSPEQARGQKELDVRSDIYSLGVTLYQMAVGNLPFQGDEAREVMAKQVRQKLQGEKVKNQLSNHMHYIIEKMMSKEKDFRFQNPAEIIEEIKSFRQAQEHMEYEPDEEDTDLSPF